MNFLQEVISSAEEVEINEINKRVPELQSTVEKLEIKTMEQLNRVYKSFRSRHANQEDIELKQLTDEINLLLKQAQIAVNKLSEQGTLCEHIKSLKNMSETMTMLNKISAINKDIQKFEEMMESKAYFDAVTAICQAEKLLIEIRGKYSGRVVHVYYFIVARKNALLAHLTFVFKGAVVEKFDETISTLKIKRDATELQGALLALHYHSPTIYCLDAFSQFLCSVIARIVENVVNVTIRSDDEFNILEVSVINSSKPTNYLEVYSSLKTLVAFLDLSFNFTVGEGLHLLKHLGSEIGDCITMLLIKTCLEVPALSEEEDHQRRRQLIQETDNFIELLKCYYLLSKDQSEKLIYHVNHLELTYNRKNCSEVYMQCQEILKKDLNDTEELEIPNPDCAKFPATHNSHCSVSKNCIELIKFLESVLDLSLEITDGMSSYKLVITVQNVVINYGGSTVTVHHECMYLPRLVALLHNNCCYVIHKLTEWNKKRIVPKGMVVGDPQKGPSEGEAKFINSFNSEIASLQQFANNFFEAYVVQQSQIMTDILDVLKIPENPDAYLELEGCFRKCIEELLKLKSGWYDVLPHYLYNKSMGKLLNHLCFYMVSHIIRCEKISPKAAEKFYQTFKELASVSPRLFTLPCEIGIYVTAWYKFNELMFMFEANLSEIENRWSRGMGPLAQHFKVETSPLIMALHEDSPRRASLLAKIGRVL